MTRQSENTFFRAKALFVTLAAAPLVAMAWAGGAASGSAKGAIRVDAAGARTAGSDAWTSDQVLLPEQLAKQLSGPHALKPNVLCVGFPVLYQGAHIPGALYAGPAREAAGLDKIKKEAGRLPRDKELVLYCGCCPWQQCPNIRPAFTALRAMGFKRLKVLEIANDFATDWVKKGFPVERGPQ